jgi:hypothetical protein
MSIIAQNTKNKNFAASATVPQPIILPQPTSPILIIDGKENLDVYLQSLDVTVEVTGNIAATRYTMVFKNKTDRILEGELIFPLPDGRSVTFYALDIEGRMREAVPVEKALVTHVFEEIQQQAAVIDSGIPEKVEGNNFRTRIYPLPQNGTRTISIGYEEKLPLENGSLYYHLPMDYPKLENFSVKVIVWKSEQKPITPESENELHFDRIGENYVASFSRENYQPSRALVFALSAPIDTPQVIMQSAQGYFYFLATAMPKTEPRKKRWSDELAIIWDVSLSGLKRDLQREIDMLDIIFADKNSTNVHLYFLNNRFTKTGEYKIIDGNWDELRKALETAVFDGGTDFSQINLNDITGDEILFFSDGISTLSDANFLENIDMNQSIRPIHCIVSSPKIDYSVMRLISSKTKGKFVNANILSSAKLKEELLNETLQFLGTEHGNAIREIYPNIATPVYDIFSIAGISMANDAEVTLLFGFNGKVEERIKIRLNAQKAVGQGNIEKIWAQKKIAELDLEYEKNRDELTMVGRQFGIATRNTSLIVLEYLNDYIRFGIEPPASEPELRVEYWYEVERRENWLREAGTESNMLSAAVRAAERLRTWWNTGANLTPARRNNKAQTRAILQNIFDDTAHGLHKVISIIQDIANILQPIRLNTTSTVFFESSPQQGSDAALEKREGTITTLKFTKNDNDYLKKLTGKLADDYQTYLKLRDDYANSSSFYFDISDWFKRHNDMETALRILTSIAELEFENASLYRLLGYRFKEYGEYELQKFVTKKVLQWRPMEPQSYRDYALALADNGETQAALDSLYSLLTRTFSANIIRDSRGIEEVVVTEINRLIAKHPYLNISEIDERLIMNIPVDIRVAINWNMNNVDITLHVIDPNYEPYYCNVCVSYHLTNIVKRLSANNTRGYGPEQYLVKEAIAGKHQIYAFYVDTHKFAAAGPTTVMAEIYTNYAGPNEQRKVVTLQLPNTGRRDGRKARVAEIKF